MRKAITTPSESSLLSQISQGNNQAFSELYDRYWDIAFSEACKRLKNADQAKDIVQDIFVNIWLRRDSLVINNFSAYLYTSIRNRVLKQLSVESHHTFFDRLGNLPAAAEADTNLVWKEFSASYEKMISQLPAKRQLIFRLRFQENLPTKAIADYLHLSRKTVQNQLGKAIYQLRVSLSHFFLILILLLSGLVKFF